MGAVSTIMSALSRFVPDFIRSDGQIEAKIIDVVGSYADAEALERENTLNIIFEALADRQPSQASYYRRKAMEFQYGDPVLYEPINQRAYYNPVNPSAQIIKQAYITGEYPNYVLLVNGVNAAGHLRKLTTDELNAFTTYFSEFQPFTPITVNSTEVAQISDANLVIYVRRGTDAQEAVNQIKLNLTAYESEFRRTNKVSVTEIVDVIQRYAPVTAVSMSSARAVETALDGSQQTVFPEQGVFNLTTGVFTFTTEITTNLIKTLD